MSYLLDKKNKRRKMLYVGSAGLFIIFIFYFRVPVFNFLSSTGAVVFRPVLVLKNNTFSLFSNIGSAFSFKSNLVKEQEVLKTKLSEYDAMLLNYNAILDENNKIKEILGRKDEKSEMLLSAILSKPNRSPYDTLVIDVGSDNDVKEGDTVFALGNVPIGRVATVQNNSSKVVLFSNSGEKTEVVVSKLARPQGLGGDVFMQIIGRGGGNFEMILPRDFVLEKGSTVSLPGIFPYVVAKVETIISDPRDSFAKALLSSPVNIQELKFVQIAQ